MANGVQIGALHISLSADSAVFDKGMDAAAKKSKETTKDIEDDGGKMADAIKSYAADIAASMAAAFAINHMADRIKEQIDYADSLADVAARSHQSAEALSKFEYALHFQDATLQDYTDGLQKMEQNMAAASEGSKEQAIIFEALDIKLRNQNQMLRNSGDVMMDFANKLANMADGATKTQLAMDVLGKSAGPKLLPFLSQGQEGIEEFTREAERMGLVVSTDFSNAAGELNDTLDKIAFSAKGAWRVIAEDLTPALIDVSKAFLDTTQKTDATTTVLSTPFSSAIRGVGGLLVALDGAFEVLGDKIGKAGALFVTFLGAVSGSKSAAEQFNAILNDPTNNDKLDEASKRVRMAFWGMSEAEKQAAKESEETAKLLSIADEYFANKETKAFEETKKRLAAEQVAREKAKAKKDKEDQDTLKAQEKMLEDVSKLEKSFFTPIQAENDRYQTEQDLLNAALKQKLITQQRFQDAAEAIASRHQNNILKIQNDSMDAYFAKEKENYDRIKAAQDAIDAGRKEGKDFVKGIILDGSDEATKAQAEHDAKMAKLEELRAAEKITDDEYYAAKEEAERQHALKMLDIKMGTGHAMQDLGNAFHKGMLNGALAFFAADYGGFSAHSRKLFEIQKAAKTANILLNIPETVSTAYKAGMAAGGPFGPAVGAAYAAAALAMQLGQLKQIQSQSFGGSSAGASVVGGAPAALPATSSPTSQAEQRQQEQQSQTTYVRIPEDAILTGRKMLDFIDEAMGDGKQLTNLRFIPA